MSIGKRIVLFLLTAVLITVFILYFGQTLLEVLTPILLAAIQAYLFLPFIKPLEKRTNRSAAIILGFAILTVVNIAALVILVPVFVEQIKAFSIVVPHVYRKYQCFNRTIYAAGLIIGNQFGKFYFNRWYCQGN